MTKQQEQAIARVCAHECMARELIEALEGAVKAWDDMVFPNDCGGYEVSKHSSFEFYRAFDNARAVLAKARGEAA